MTSNAGARELAVGGLGFKPEDRLLSYAEVRSATLSELKRRFNPEFVNRLDDIVVFRPLDRGQIARILELNLSELGRRLGGKGISLTVSRAAKDWLAEKGYDPSYGARPMRRLIQTEIEDTLAALILEGKLSAGGLLSIGVEEGKLRLSAKKAAAPKGSLAPS
jgi:ATP-dependent Clp protease ATP-binding subunit ClpC